VLSAPLIVDAQIAAFGRCTEVDAYGSLSLSLSRPFLAFSFRLQGCFDWWGVTDAAFDTHDSLQLNVVMKLVNDLPKVHCSFLEFA
jgi:hypothetical protein